MVFFSCSRVLSVRGLPCRAEGVSHDPAYVQCRRSNLQRMELQYHARLFGSRRTLCFKPVAQPHHSPHEQPLLLSTNACASTAEMSMSGCPMSRVAEIAGLVIAVTFFAKACKAFATTSAATGAVSRGRTPRVPDEL